MYDRVLVATDGTAGSETAVERAVALAREHDATVAALYVVDTSSSMGHFDPVVERAEAAGEAAVEAVADRAAAAGVRATKAFRYGRPHEEIVGYAADHDVDLVVVGKHERTGIRRFVDGGSTAERVVRDAPVPVLVAGETAGRTATGCAAAPAD